MILVIFPLSFLSFCFYSVTITFPMVTWSAFDRVDSASLPVPFLFVSGSLLFRLRSFSVPFRLHSFFDPSRLRFIPSRLSSVTSLMRSFSNRFLSFPFPYSDAVRAPFRVQMVPIWFVSFRFLIFLYPFWFRSFSGWFLFSFVFYSLSVSFLFGSFPSQFRFRCIGFGSDRFDSVSLPVLLLFGFGSPLFPLRCVSVSFLFRSI